MKRIIIITIITAVTLIGYTLTVCAQIVSDQTRDSLLSAPPAKKSAVEGMISKDYPGMGKETYLYLSQTYPDFPVRFLKSKIEALKKMDGKTLANLYREVSKDVDGKYSQARRDFRKSVLQIATEKYPGVIDDIKSFREEKGFRATFAPIVSEKYPGLRADCLKVIRDKNPGILLEIGRDAMDTLLRKDPTLLLDLKLEATELMESQFPELLKEASMGRMNPIKMGKLIRENPRLGIALMDRIGAKFDKRISAAKEEVVATIIEKHSSELLALSDDLLTIISKKYPGLLNDAILTAFDCRSSFQKDIREKHADFFNEVVASRDKNLPNFARDILASLDSHNPSFRKELRDASKKEFPDLDKNLRSFGEKKFPGLEDKIRSLLK